MTQPRTLRNFIGGEYVDATGDASIDLVNPATGQVVAHAPVSTQADVDAAYASAEAGFAEWSEATPGERQSALLKFADALEARADDLGRDVEPEATVFTNVSASGADAIRPWVEALRNVGFAVFAKPKTDEDSDVDSDMVAHIERRRKHQRVETEVIEPLLEVDAAHHDIPTEETAAAIRTHLG